MRATFWHTCLRKDKRHSPENTGFKVAPGSAVIPSDLAELAQKYRQISIPTLILWGREDTIVPLTHGERLHHAILNSRLIILDHCGHIPHEETPEAALHAMQTFISGDQKMALP